MTCKYSPPIYIGGGSLPLYTPLQESITNIITSYARDGDLHVDESGSTYRWVGILRAAEKHWKTSEEHPLFRTEVEGISGSSPQLIYKTQDR